MTISRKMIEGVSGKQTLITVVGVPELGRYDLKEWDWNAAPLGDYSKTPEAVVYLKDEPQLKELFLTYHTAPAKIDKLLEHGDERLQDHRRAAVIYHALAEVLITTLQHRLEGEHKELAKRARLDLNVASPDYTRAADAIATIRMVQIDEESSEPLARKLSMQSVKVMLENAIYCCRAAPLAVQRDYVALRTLRQA